MVMTSNLSAETRKSVGKGKSRALRKEGKIPAIVSVSYTHLTLPTTPYV